MSMNHLQSFFPRAYRLRPLVSQAGDHIAQLWIRGPKASKNLLLPYSIGLGYFVIPTANAGFAIEAEDFRVEPLDWATSLWVRLRLSLLFKKKKYLTFEDFSVFCYGPKPERKRFTTFNQHMFNIGVSLDGDLIAAHPELIEGWGDDDRAPPPRPRAPGKHRSRSSCTSITRKPGAISPAFCVASLSHSTSSSRRCPGGNG